jgi:hypothetical protein
MKRIAVLLVLFGAGFLVASFALADDGGKGKHKSTTATTKTTTTTTKTTTTTPKKKCKNVSLKGTASPTSFTITVEKSSKAFRKLKVTSATLTFSGKVSVNAKMCSIGSAAPTFELRNLHVRSGHDEDDDDD